MLSRPSDVECLIILQSMFAICSELS